MIYFKRLCSSIYNNEKLFRNKKYDEFVDDDIEIELSPIKKVDRKLLIKSPEVKEKYERSILTKDGMPCGKYTIKIVIK